jgi:Na+-transporting methylmalonyl-CoA/oxaloacetate decarboxylase gamma subunit
MKRSPGCFFGNYKLEIVNSWRSQAGVSSMMVLILVMLLIIVGWEIGEFAQRFTQSGSDIPPNATGNKCVGSNTAFDCYDQDEGSDFEDTAPPSEPLIFGWQDDGKP